MTLKELLSSVSAEEYADYPLYQELLKLKPEYDSSRHIEVKMKNGKVAVYNVHIGSLGDIVTYPIDVDPDLQVTKIQLLDAILAEMTSQHYDEAEQHEQRLRRYHQSATLRTQISSEDVDVEPGSPVCAFCRIDRL